MGACASLPHEDSSRTKEPSHASYLTDEVVVFSVETGSVEVAAETKTGDQVALKRVARRFMRPFMGHVLLRHHQLAPLSSLHYTFLFPSKLILSKQHMCLTAPIPSGGALLHYLQHNTVDETTACFLFHQLLSTAQHLLAHQGDARDLQLGLMFMEQGTCEKEGKESGKTDEGEAPLVRVFHPGRLKKMGLNQVLEASNAAVTMRASNGVAELMHEAISDAEERPAALHCEADLGHQLGALLGALLMPHLPAPLLERLRLSDDEAIKALLRKHPAQRAKKDCPLSPACQDLLSLLLPHEAEVTSPPPLQALHQHAWLHQTLPDPLASLLNDLSCQQKVNDLRRASAESFYSRSELNEKLVQAAEDIVKGRMDWAKGWITAPLDIGGVPKFGKSAALGKPSFRIISGQGEGFDVSVHSDRETVVEEDEEDMME